MIWPPTSGLPPLAPGDRVHLVGVGGAGMSGLARVLAALGLVVSGSDRDTSGELERLRREGLDVHAGHDARHVPGACALVVRSPAVPDDNPELVAARQADVPITKRAVILGALMDAAVGVAIAGTHGKTTTAGMVATVLELADLSPTFFVGGQVTALGANAKAGSGAHVVIEADEYDRSFLHGHPAMAVITNVEHDHPDIYPELDDVVDAFRAFAGRVREDGLIVANAGSAAVALVLSAARCPVVTFHVEGAGEPFTAPDWRAHALLDDADGQLFDVERDGECLGTWRIGLPGRHNVANALAALAIADALGVERDLIRSGLAAYGGTDRRFEPVGRAHGVTIIDDYAHHPTAVEATIAAARQRFPRAAVHVVLQPHTFTRVALMSDAFAAALAGADGAIVTPVFGAREVAVEGATPEDIARSAAASVAPDLAAAASWAADRAAPGDVVLFLGAGDIQRASRECLRQLRTRAARHLLAEANARGLGGDVAAGAPLASHTSLRVGGPADALVRVSSPDDLAAWASLAWETDVPLVVLGRGSNVLAADGPHPGLVIVNRCEDWQLDAEDGAGTLRAQSGVTLAVLGRSLARDGWSGLEAGIGIPGSVGAAVVTNAGAHGWEMSDVVVSARILEPDGIRSWTHEELAFRYRGSALRDGSSHVILGVTLRVQRADPAALAERMAGFVAHRRATQPTSPSIGSMFKNPPGDYAGRLIDAAGLKGRRCGDAEISTKHANFFVNHGQATAADIRELVALARHEVSARFGIDLELEIELIGEHRVQ